jgi:hypothetical protein
MDFITSPVFVLLILVAVTIAAFSFEPAKFVGAWREIGALYESERLPTSLTFRDVSIKLGADDFAHIDAALDDEGFWMVFQGTTQGKAANCVLIPWDCVRFRQDKGDKQNFQIRGKNPIELMVSAELGTALQRRSDRFEVEEQL